LQPSIASVAKETTWTPYHEEIQGKAYLSALFVKEGKTFARFVEYSGGQAEVRVNWLGKPVNLTEVDLRERQKGGLGAVLQLGPWEVATVRLENE
jgi:hypothetical protein